MVLDDVLYAREYGDLKRSRWIPLLYDQHYLDWNINKIVSYVLPASINYIIDEFLHTYVLISMHDASIMRHAQDLGIVW